MRGLLIIELNEFNLPLLVEAAQLWQLPTIKRILALPKSSTLSVDNGRLLEPWVQWVSIHTGLTAAQHGVRDIGEQPKPGQAQLWERLSARGISSGIWGAMNANPGQAAKCRFFMADLWNAPQTAFPSSVWGLSSLPSFLARNRSALWRPGVLKAIMQTLSGLRRNRLLTAALEEVARSYRRVLAEPSEAYSYFSAFEYLSTLAFCQHKRRHRPQVSLLFLNMLAHAQHYHWATGPLRENKRLQYVFETAERSLAAALDCLESAEDVVVCSGFSQEQTREGGYIYRPRRHEQFLASIGAPATQVQAHMTNEARLTYASVDEAERAVQLLETLQTSGQPLFEVRRLDPVRVFYRVCFDAEVDPGAAVRGATPLRFTDHFKLLGRHTGRHAPGGTVFSSFGPLPDCPNHELEQHLLQNITA